MSKNNIRIPKRSKDTHKGDYGKVLVVAGSSGMLGAGILSSRGALRSGSGLIYLAVPKELKNIANLATPEVIVLSHEEISSIKADSIVFGPGLGQSEEIKSLINSLMVFGNRALVIDADGLNILSSDPKLLSKLPGNSVLTPHPGEMSRLTGLPIDEIQNNREQVAREYSKRWNAIVVLKGNKTVVAGPLSEIYINETGNPGMASPGVGDVLSGVIASFLGQDFPVFESVCSAVYVHGLAGDLAAKELGEYGMTATDLVNKLPAAILKVENG